MRKNILKGLTIAVPIVILFWYIAFSLPEPLFNSPLSMVLLDKEGDLLGAKTAKDEQWRFPKADSIPEKYIVCVTQYEDKRFFNHFGVDLRASIRALRNNIRNKKIVNGGSTLSMQVISLSNGKKVDNLWEKLLEIVQATRLEWKYSKKQILELYASNAPFGGNVVGIDAASWRYFGKPKEELSWAEYATLAVLPNNPSMIHPGRNRDLLLSKRNALLLLLKEREFIDGTTYSLGIEESVPEIPYRLPMLAPHLLESLLQDYNGYPEKIYRSTLDRQIQSNCSEVAELYNRQWLSSNVRNLAVLVLNTQTAEVLAYIGNGEAANNLQHNKVNMVKAKRSAGSLWKPFLFAYSLDKGLISPRSILNDIPLTIDGFRPQNFDLGFRGIVPAEDALIASLNIPFVSLLKDYGLENFHFNLKKMGVSTLFRTAQGYGLPLILGGAETTLEETTALFAYLGRTVKNYQINNGKYIKNEKPTKIFTSYDDNERNVLWTKEYPYISAGAAYITLEALSKLNRPEAARLRSYFNPNEKIAWKTGTSFGFKDAWAVGVTPQYTIGVWVGNADGEGRPDVIGVEAAAPLLFQLFHLLQPVSWFEPPYDDLKETAICEYSGASPHKNCPHLMTLLPIGAPDLNICRNHQTILWNPTTGKRGKRDCPNAPFYEEKNWFVLSPTEAYYHAKINPYFKPLPPFDTDCLGQNTGPLMQIVYPNTNAKIYLPLNFNEKRENIIFEATHQEKDAKIRWHINGNYLGETQFHHHFIFEPEPGKHLLTITDESGNTGYRYFEVIK